MKICLDIRVSTKGGTSTFIDSFVRELECLEHDHEIHFVFNPDTSALNGSQIRAAAVPHNNRFLEFQWSQRTLRRVIGQGNYDAYHSLKHVGPLSCPVKSIYRVPAVGQFTGQYPLPTLDRFYWTKVAGRAYRNAELLIAVSDYVRRGLIDALKISEDRVITVHNGVDPRFHQLPHSERSTAIPGISGPFMLCVGNLLPVKNFETVIKAYAVLRDRHTVLPQLVLAGGGQDPCADRLKEMVSANRLERQVIFVGYKSADSLLQLYNAAELLVHPSLHEGFSFTILEAMACGLPIVTSATSSIPEAAGEAAVYCSSPTDYEELANCIERVLDDSELAARLSQSAIERASEFTWQQCVAKTIAAYDRLK